jgi:hypothetical protein
VKKSIKDFLISKIRSAIPINEANQYKGVLAMDTK